MTSKFDIIDSHLHVYDLKVRANFPKQNPRSLGTYEFPNEEPLIRDMQQEYAKEIANKAGVKKVVFMMCYDDCPEESQWVYDKAQNVDLVIGIVAGLDLTKHDKLKKYINEFKTNFKQPKFCGIRHHVFYDESIILDELFQEGLAILEEHNIPFDLSINDPILKHIPKIAAKFPKLKMVIDHLAKAEVNKGEGYLQGWKDITSEIAKFPNVYMKLSGLGTYFGYPSQEIFKPYVEHSVKVFGAQRCMFASDWPVCRLARNTKEIDYDFDYGDCLKLLQSLTSHLTEDEQKAIFHDTVVNFYNL